MMKILHDHTCLNHENRGAIVPLGVMQDLSINVMSVEQGERLDAARLGPRFCVRTQGLG